jgi:hypothetical protein
MSLKRGTEIPTIDVALVTVKQTVNSVTTEIAIDTSNKVAVSPQIETTNATKLIIKGALKAQKQETQTLTGHQITLTDNVFTPELVKILQGGTIKYDAVETTKIIGYTPPVAGETIVTDPFELCCYSAQYNAAGTIVQYEKITYPNCKGVPVAFGSEDGVFRSTDYTINSAPNNGQAPYDIDYVAALPTIS